MDSLTKENFWNELMEHYPSEMELFCKWIDEYKKRVDWNKLFNPSILIFRGPPKFHDLPIAMQAGIFMQFACENKFDDDDASDMKSVGNHIREWFKEAKAFKSREQNLGESL